MNFSFDTIHNFDAHIEQSIPTYSKLSEMIVKLASYFVREDSNVLDLGCSTGRMIGRLHQLHPSAFYVGFDVSENLLGKECPPSENISFLKEDIRCAKFPKSNLILSVFMLQFLAQCDRLAVLQKAFDSLNRGGALILTEKVFVEDGQVQDILNFVHYDFKLQHFTAEEVLKKQSDLRKIMHPLTERENLSLLAAAGFSKVYPFWQSLLFKGWLCIK